MVHFSALGINKTPCPLLILLFITVLNEKLLHTLRRTHSECTFHKIRGKCVKGGLEAEFVITNVTGNRTSAPS